MATVIEARTASGKLLGRCDATCHKAKGSTCRCICGGRNHGAEAPVGVEQIRGEVIAAWLAERDVDEPAQMQLRIL